MARSEPGSAPRPRLHWIVLGVLAGASLWCLVGAVVAAVLTAWLVAAVLLAAAIVIAVVTAVLVRPRGGAPAAPAAPTGPPAVPDLAQPHDADLPPDGGKPVPRPEPDPSHELPRR